MKAEQAREIADSYHQDHQYKVIEMNVAQEAAKGKYSVSFINLTPHTKELLKKDGYKISDNGTGVYGPSYEISWE